MTQKAYEIVRRPFLFSGTGDDEICPGADSFLEGLAERYNLPETMAVFDEDRCIDVLGYDEEGGYRKLRELTVGDEQYLFDRENPIGDIEVALIRGETCIVYHGDAGQGYWSLWCSPTLAETLVKEAME